MQHLVQFLRVSEPGGMMSVGECVCVYSGAQEKGGKRKGSVGRR